MGHKKWDLPWRRAERRVAKANWAAEAAHEAAERDEFRRLVDRLLEENRGVLDALEAYDRGDDDGDPVPVA